MEKSEADNVECKLDHINEAIHKLIHDLNVSKTNHEPFSFISPINSFTESFLDIHENFPEFSQNLPSESPRLFDKFQEMMTENDRLQMRVEDLTGQLNRSLDPTFEIRFSRENLQALALDIEKFLNEKAEFVIFKLKKDSFFMQSAEKHEKIVYFPREIKSKYFENTCKERQDLEDLDLALQLIKKKAELDVTILSYSKKQEKVMEIEEKLMEKLEFLEILKVEYMSKFSEIDKKPESHHSTPVKTKRTCSCSDQSDNSYFTETASFQGSISRMLNNLEKVVKQQYCKDSLIEENESKDVTLQYYAKKKLFNESLGQFSNKEAYVLNYFRELSQFYDQKFKELNEYEKYLQETWIESFGNQKMAYAFQKASQKNFETSKLLNKLKLEIAEKDMRLSKIKLITQEERKRLEFHRKKILFERQALFQQQNDVESALHKIMSFPIPCKFND